MIKEIVKGVWALSRLASSNERQRRALIVPLCVSMGEEQRQ